MKQRKMSTYNRHRGGALLVAVVALALSIRCVLATQYVVGEGICSVAAWALNYCDYNKWSIQNDYFVGDSLVFKFTAGDSDVAEVSKDDYDGCRAGQAPANPLYVYSRPPVTIPLSKPGTFYFASTVGAFLCFVQNMAVIVNGSTTDATPSGRASSSTPSTTSASTASLATTTSSKSGHSSIVAPVVGSVGSVLVIAKIVAVSYYLRRRRTQKLNRLNGQGGQPQHAPAPYPVFNFNVNSHEDVNVHVLDNQEIPFGVLAGQLNP